MGVRYPAALLKHDCRSPRSFARSLALGERENRFKGKQCARLLEVKKKPRKTFGDGLGCCGTGVSEVAGKRSEVAHVGEKLCTVSA